MSRLDFQLTVTEKLSVHGGTPEPPTKGQRL
jgi:hypothetical protein